MRCALRKGDGKTVDTQRSSVSPFNTVDLQKSSVSPFNSVYVQESSVSRVSHEKLTSKHPSPTPSLLAKHAPVVGTSFPSPSPPARYPLITSWALNCYSYTEWPKFWGRCKIYFLPPPHHTLQLHATTSSCLGIMGWQRIHGLCSHLLRAGPRTEG